MTASQIKDFMDTPMYKEYCARRELFVKKETEDLRTPILSDMDVYVQEYNKGVIKGISYDIFQIMLDETKPEGAK